MSSSSAETREVLCIRLQPRRRSAEGSLELGAGRRFAGHDLHVLGEDGLESLVPVDHGTKHQWLEETEILGC